MEEKCIYCGSIIPEGRQVCPNCEKEVRCKTIDKLKPCPFCNGKVESIKVSYGVVGVITCTNCKTKFVIPWNEAETTNDLFNAWNRRVNENE